MGVPLQTRDSDPPHFTWQIRISNKRDKWENPLTKLPILGFRFFFIKGRGPIQSLGQASMSINNDFKKNLNSMREKNNLKNPIFIKNT